MKRIQLAKPSFDEREAEAVRRVLESGRVVQGAEVEAFEAAIAELHQARHCVAVSSGTAALHIAYLALGVGPGEAVFVPSFAWPSAANMAVLSGARPVFVDVLPGTYNMDPASLRAEIGRCLERGWGRPRAIVPVHEFGLAAEMDAILAIGREHGLEIIEDAACALGATCRGKPVGTFGSLGIFSFHPRKSITTGEGGAIVTNDSELAARCRQWRNHGQSVAGGKREFTFAGLNYRMTEIQAAIGRVQLGKLSEILRKRRELAGEYLEQLAGSAALALPRAAGEHTWQTFMVVLDDDIDREALIARLSQRGIEAGPGSISGHRLAVYRERFGYAAAELPESDRLDRQGLALPLYAAMQECDAHQCVSRLLEELA